MTDRANECWRLLFRVTDALREQANIVNQDALAVSDITVGQMRVLAAVSTLSSNGQVLMLKTLADKVKLTSGAVSLIVDSLVKRNLLERCHSETDRRAVNIRLSEKGQDKVNRYIEFFHDESAKFLSGLSEADQEKFLNILQQFLQSVR